MALTRRDGGAGAVRLLLLVGGWGCGGGGSGGGPPATATQPGGERLAMKVVVPPTTEDFCVWIRILDPEGSQIASLQETYPAGTPSVESVVPNVPAGEGLRAEVGLFEGGVCADMASADWYALSDPFSVGAGEVTLVQVALEARLPLGTGTVILRGEQAMVARPLHGEVVYEGDSPEGRHFVRPIPGAVCDIYEGKRMVGAVVSGDGEADLGVLATEVPVRLTTRALGLVCRADGFATVREAAPLILDPADADYGTFTATVEMRPGLGLHVVESTSRGIRLRLTMPPLELQTVETEEGSFERIVTYGGGLPLIPADEDHWSWPEVPAVTITLALPLGPPNEEMRPFRQLQRQVPRKSPGMVIVHRALKPEGEPVVVSARLYPVQRQGSDFAPPGGEPPPEPPFEFDETVYRTGKIPFGWFDVLDQTGSGQGLAIVRLLVPLADYDPENEVLTYYPAYQFELAYPEGACFYQKRDSSGLGLDEVDQDLENDPPLLLHTAVNWEIALERVCPTSPPAIETFGARFLIVTDPALVAAAHDLEVHKESRGINTRVVTTETTGSTDTEIKDYLWDAFLHWAVRPRWVLFLGDAELIPTHYGGPNRFGEATNAGDIWYGQFGGSDTELPVFGIGRIPVDTLEQAQSVVDKIKAYEATPPPVFSPYYSTLTFVAQFQDDDRNGYADRWFAETSEWIRDRVVPEGLTAERIYSAPPTSPVRFWADGTPIPAELEKPGFAWDGSTGDVVDAFNAGRSIIYHRDHGWWTTWVTPWFHTSNFDSVSVPGTQNPFVFSINCSSGGFDNETQPHTYKGLSVTAGGVYWAEQLLRKPNGAIAVIGDTRVSDTALNNSLAKGLFDAVWPSLLSTYGPATPVREVGDVLNHAKGYLRSLGYSHADLAQEMLIYNVLGDPTVRIPSRRPWLIAVPELQWVGSVLRLSVVSAEPRAASYMPDAARMRLAGVVISPFDIRPPPEDPVAVLQTPDGEVVARGIVRAGTAQLDVGGAEGPFILTLSGPGLFPVRMEVDPANQYQ